MSALDVASTGMGMATTWQRCLVLFFGWNPFSEVIDDGGGKSFGKKTMLIV
jgi:hypothetical protein